MSVKLMGEVWELKIDHATSHVLLAMADHARDDGSRCFPSVGYLSWKTNYSLRQVQRILANLEDTGIIIPVAYQNGGGGFATEYQLVLAAAPRKESYQVAGTKLSGKLRTATIARFNHVCQYCNKSGDAGKGPEGKPWEIDRIVPAKQGGLYVSANVTLSCGPCNREKGATLSSEVSEPPTSTTGEVTHLSPKGAIGDTELSCLSQKDAIGDIEIAQMAPQPSGNHQEPSIEPSVEDMSDLPSDPPPDWFQVISGFPKFKTSLADAEAWLSSKGISPDLAEVTAYGVKDFIAQPKNKGRDPWATFQNWARRDAVSPRSRPPPAVSAVNSTDYVAMKAAQAARRAEGG
jgi:hypothetical protein